MSFFFQFLLCMQKIVFKSLNAFKKTAQYSLAGSIWGFVFLPLIVLETVSYCSSGWAGINNNLSVLAF